jgi:hypothetical protein
MIDFDHIDKAQALESTSDFVPNRNNQGFKGDLPQQIIFAMIIMMFVCCCCGFFGSFSNSLFKKLWGKSSRNKNKPDAIQEVKG